MFLKIFLTPFIKTKCHEVPPCPRCTSTKTGRYIFVMNNASDIEKLIASYMKKGELIKPILGFHNSEHPNLYCEDCGAEWYDEVFPKYVTDKELEEIKIAKGISKTSYENMKNFKNIVAQEKKMKKKEKRKQKRIKSTKTTKIKRFFKDK